MNPTPTVRGMLAFVFAAAAALTAGPFVGRAWAAAPALIVASPEVDAEHGEVAALIGATRPDGTAARLADVKLLLDDAEAGAAVGDDAIGDYSADHPKWTPPIAIGVVSPWDKGGP
jgi:hypothetical protein